MRYGLAPRWHQPHRPSGLPRTSCNRLGLTEIGLCPSPFGRFLDASADDPRPVISRRPSQIFAGIRKTEQLEAMFQADAAMSPSGLPITSSTRHGLTE